jgi:hypothetical protein
MIGYLESTVWYGFPGKLKFGTLPENLVTHSERDTPNEKPQRGLSIGRLEELGAPAYMVLPARSGTPTAKPDDASTPVDDARLEWKTIPVLVRD